MITTWFIVISSYLIGYFIGRRTLTEESAKKAYYDLQKRVHEKYSDSPVGGVASPDQIHIIEKTDPKYKRQREGTDAMEEALNAMPELQESIKVYKRNQ